jgi:tRNA-Thr(GGU) m(6)t(6)A37 methyltransferase TsaA
MKNKKTSKSDINKLKLLMSYWVEHNKEHIRDNQVWLHKIEKMGLKKIAVELKKSIELSKEANKHMELANQKLGQDRLSEIKGTSEKNFQAKSGRSGVKYKSESINFNQIGIIRTPYKDNAPYQPVHEDKGTFYIEINPQYADGLNKLSKFYYIYVIYYIHLVKKKLSMTISTPWTDGTRVGLFASRSPVRPNPIGLSVVKIKKIKDNKVFTSGLDVFDKTPLLDIKPYVKDLDSKSDANYGWIGDINGYEHLLLHIKGIPHNH